MNEDTALSEPEIERYARHIIMPEIGGTGQQKLKNAKVCIIGAGGLGSPVLMYLAAAGVGTLGIIDDDVVSLSNLQRQIIHASKTVGQNKTQSASDTLQTINPHCTIVQHALRLTRNNGAEIFSAYDVIVDGSDNFETRYLVADMCEQLKKPLVSAALGRFDGSLTVLAPYENDNPRYRDLFPHKPDDGTVPSCAQAGILGVTAGVIGTLQATEAIKLITHIGTPLIGKILLYNALDARFDTMRYKRQT